MAPLLQTISSARFQDLPLGYSRKKQTEGVEELEFPRVLKKEHVDIPQGSIKKEVEFPAVLVFSLRISKGCHTILRNFHESGFAFSRIYKGKVINL